jgi:hypothetical protein
MRKFTLRFLLVMTLLAPLGLFAQDLLPSQVSIVARSHFQGAVPGVTPAWKSANKGGFEAWFQQEGIQKVYVYDSQGSLRIKKSGAKSAELPAPLTASLTKQYGQANFKTAYKVITSEKKRYFEIIVARPTGDDLWHFTPEGTLIGKRISSGDGEKPVVVANAGQSTSNGTPPRADASPVSNAPGYEEEDSKDLYISEDLDMLDEDLEDIDILEEEDSLEEDLLDEELLDEEEEDFDEEMENDLNGDL